MLAKLCAQSGVQLLYNLNTPINAMVISIPIFVIIFTVNHAEFHAGLKTFFDLYKNNHVSRMK